MSITMSSCPLTHSLLCGKHGDVPTSQTERNFNLKPGNGKAIEKVTEEV
jgi:hypothetical protein